MLNIPDGTFPDRPSVYHTLAAEYGKLWVVHRLDAGNSGVMIFARKTAAQRNLDKQFQQHQVQKTNHLVALGDTHWREKLIEIPLRVNGDRQHRTVVSHTAGKPARTSFKVIEHFASGFSLL